MIKPHLFEVWTHGENAEPLGVIAFEHVEWVYAACDGVVWSAWFDVGAMLVRVNTHQKTGALKSIDMFDATDPALFVWLCPYPHFANKQFISIPKIIDYIKEHTNA